MDVENASKERARKVLQTGYKAVQMRLKGLAAFVQACNHKRTGDSTPEMFGVFFKHLVINRTLDPPQIDHLTFKIYYGTTLKCKQECLVSKLIDNFLHE